MKKEFEISEPFDHPRNINFGKARVPYIEHCVISGQFVAGGWVLPGGGRTSDREHAMQAAAVMDRIMRAAI